MIRLSALILITTAAAALSQPAIPVETPLMVDIRGPDAVETPILNGKSRNWEDFDAELARLQKTFGNQDPVVIRLSERTPLIVAMRASTLARKYYFRVFASLTKSDGTTIPITLSIEPLDERDLPRWMAGPPMDQPSAK
jgi:hypothetical protein